ncbi:GEVED domain-containing protein [Flavobacterium sp. K5-23]|uniref:Ig-like domain-containing protein n=1 Tax=Flavobacterium sp. K5-23 TaxID=2746225 RepID=UPI00200D8A3B|nr:GEVED domain-containing protein [Flavobacterium sp. K5-23]UQD57336.1 hypothetical protein FLAK523_13415 [Flavobacterium sp. K5-23]
MFIPQSVILYFSNAVKAIEKNQKKSFKRTVSNFFKLNKGSNTIFKKDFLGSTVLGAKLIFLLFTLFSFSSILAQPIINGTQNIACQGQTVNYSLSNSFTTYQWTVTGGTPSSGTGSTINVTWGTGNRGQITVEGFNSGISQGTATRKIYIDQKSAFTTTPNQTICNGSATNLSLNFTNKSLKLNGTSDYVGISNSNLINLGITDFRTVSMWFKANDITSRQVLYNEGGATNGFSMYIEGGRVYVLGWESNSAWNAPNAAINVGQWYNITFVFDENATDGYHFKGYLDGVNIGQFNQGSGGNNGMSAHSGPVAIGSNSNIRFHNNSTSSNNYFNGYVDGFKLWNRSLTQAEIVIEKNHWLTSPVIDADLDVYIDFNNSVLDIADNPTAESGVLNGSPVYDDDAPLIPTILWSPGGASTKSITVSPASNTTYTYSLTEKLSGICSQNGSVDITVSAIIPTITSTTTGSRVGNGTVVLGATVSAGTINWYTTSVGGTAIGTGTSFTTPSISSTTTYYAEAVLNSCASSPRTAVVAVVSCAAGATNSSTYERIILVEIGTINNDSGLSAGGYADYTNLSTNTDIGKSYPIIVTNGYLDTGSQVGIWVDWNHNGDFTDSGEFFSTTMVDDKFSGTIIPPSGASLGSTRMRIRIRYNGALDPCGDTTWGEVEEYTLNVVPIITGVTPNLRCGPGTVVLGATATSGGTINWYSASTGGASLGSGISFTTGFLTNTTSYWVDATYNGFTTSSRTAVIATISSSNPIEVVSSLGASQNCYATLKLAFDAINAGTHRGVISINIVGNTTETVSALLNASGTGPSIYTSITIRPLGGVSRSISGVLSTPLIDLNGATNVIIDGLNSNGNALTISNASTSASASTLRFINNANANTVRNCTIEGSSLSATSGVVLFGSSTSATGNNNNTIESCTINATVGSDSSTVAIYSAGAVGKENTNNTIKNNSIYNFRQRGIDIAATGSTNWIITGNSIYNGGLVSATNFPASTDFYGIRILGGSGYTISGNYIGGSDVSAGGSSATYGSTLGRIGFYGISLTTTTPFTKSEIKSNVIKSIVINSVPTVANSVTFYGVDLPGAGSNIVVGGDNSIDGNTIGSNTANGSIAITTTTNTNTFTSLIRGINGLSAKGTDGVIKNNKIGGIDINNIGAAPAASTFLGIYIINASAPNILNNAVGLSQAASIRVLPTSQAVATSLTGINIGTTVTAITVDGNIVQNISRLNTTNTTGSFTGILSSAAINSTVLINNNSLRNFYVESGTTGITSGITNSSVAAGTTTATISNNILDGFNVKAFSIGTGTPLASYFIGINNTTGINTLNIIGNTLTNFSTSQTGTGNINFIRNTGAIVTSININNNFLGTAINPLVTFAAANNGAHIFINNTAGGASAALSISNNDFQGINYTGANGVGGITFILNSATTFSQNISNNTFTGLSLKTAGGVIFISNSVVLRAGGFQTVSNNKINTSFAKTVAGGTITLFSSTALSPASNLTVTHTNNNFSNITLTGATVIAGWVHTEASGTSFANKTFSGNIFNNWTTGGSAVTGMNVSGFGGTSSISNNTITNINGQAAITGLTIGGFGTATTLTVSGNNITGLSSTGTGGSVIALASANLSPLVNIDANNISGLSSTGTTASVIGINVTAATNATISNHTIHTLSASGITTPVISAISATSTGTVSIQNNTIHTVSTGGITTSGYIFNGVLVAGLLGNFTVSGNTIGNETANNISLGSGSTSAVCTFNGINNSTATGTVSITGNTIQNVTVYGSGASLFTGIVNTPNASNVSIASNTITTCSNTAGTTGQMRGIVVTTGGTVNVNQNAISGLTANNILTGFLTGVTIAAGTNVNVFQNTISGFTGNALTTIAAGSMNGISIAGGITVNAYRNKVYDLSTASSGFTGQLNGMIVSAGSNVYLYNNIIGSLFASNANNAPDAIRGISIISTVAPSNINVYFNSIYLNASSTGTTNFGTSGIFHTANATATTAFLVLRNNIIQNHSLAKGTGFTVALRRLGIALDNYSSSSNNNLYYSGTPSAKYLLYYDGTNSDQSLTQLKGRMINRDLASVTEDMISDLKFKSILGSSVDYLHINPSKATLAESGAVNISGFINDFKGSIRQGNGGYVGTGTNPDIGADEFEGMFFNVWKGAISQDWGTVGNWTRNIIPSADASIVFDDLPVNDCYLDQDRSVTNITNTQSTYGLVLNGNRLTLKGDLLFSGGATIDASAVNSTMQFSGMAVQTINAGVFKNDAVYNLNINNSNNVLLSGNLGLLNNFTTTTGLLDAFTNFPVITYAGSTLQTIGNNQFLGGKVYNLTVDNAIGVNINSNFEVTNALLINPTKKVAVSPLYQLTALGTITNNSDAAGFVLRSDATGTASLIHNSNNVVATVQRYIKGAKEDWHFLSSPVFDQGISGSWLPSGTYGTGNPVTGTGYDLNVWNESTFRWVYRTNTTSIINWNTVHPSPNFVSGKGYLYSVQDLNPTKEFIGNLNNGVVISPITITTTADLLLKDLEGFNLIGNPYPSSIDWSASSGWTRSNLVDNAGGKDMWIWNPTLNNYGVYNSTTLIGTNAISRFIAPMQGYFVKAATSGNLVVNNNTRVHTGAGNWFKTKNTQTGLIRVKVLSEANQNGDEALLQFGYNKNEPGATKLFSHVLTAPSLYLATASEYYSVRYFTNTEENKAIPVSFKSGNDGYFSLIFEFDVKDFETVLLEDRLLETLITLESAKAYKFSASKKEDPNRFVVHFNELEAKNIDKIPAIVYSKENQLIVDLSVVNVDTEISCYDVSGRLLLKSRLEGQKVHKLDINATNQMLLIQLKNENGEVRTKVLFNPLR